MENLQNHTPDWTRIAKAMCPHAPAANVDKHVPLIAEAMARFDLADADMMLMALATVTVETGVGRDKFSPTDEYISKYNTPKGGRAFSLYDFRQDIGNSREGDGALYKGRGFVQLTGKANYRRVGDQIGVDLEGNPELANDPYIAAAILAAFLKLSERAIRMALGSGNLTEARRLVNGGRHGLADFKAAMQRGRAALAQ